MYLSIVVILLIVFFLKPLTREQWIVITIYCIYVIFIFIFDPSQGSRSGAMYEGIPLILLLMHIFPFIFKVEDKDVKLVSIPLFIIILISFFNFVIK